MRNLTSLVAALLASSAAVGVATFLIVDTQRTITRLKDTTAELQAANAALSQENSTLSKQQSALTVQSVQQASDARKREDALNCEIERLKNLMKDAHLKLATKEKAVERRKEQLEAFANLLESGGKFHHEKFQKALVLWEELAQLLQDCGHRYKASEFQATLWGIYTPGV